MLNGLWSDDGLTAAPFTTSRTCSSTRHARAFFVEPSELRLAQTKQLSFGRLRLVEYHSSLESPVSSLSIMPSNMRSSRALSLTICIMIISLAIVLSIHASQVTIAKPSNAIQGDQLRDVERQVPSTTSFRTFHTIQAAPGIRVMSSPTSTVKTIPTSFMAKQRKRSRQRTGIYVKEHNWWTDVYEKIESKQRHRQPF